MPDVSAARLFPEAECVTTIGELSAWTSVRSILAAARHIEGRPLPQDQLEPSLVMPFDSQEGIFEHIITQSMGWLVAGYRVPQPKIALARSLDSQISDATAATLADARFRPDINSASPGTLAGLPPEKSAWIVEDEPWVIEMIQPPLICMMDLLHRFNEDARKLRFLQTQQQEKTDGPPAIWHRPYSDSRLPAILDALCFYIWGLELGPAWGKVGSGSIDMSYRAVNVQGVPPINTRLIDVARSSMEKMLDSLR